ncbi:Hemolysin, contains CBS domains [Sarcina sp. DSM 11001]|uniref:hemolysin family protein n=1 Tax=Sarcina sp. DSM 11001 TaxID=1798184 RepID=UPI000880807B|nr:hemolysin family protein [Sarcina sp. DSM 11001]SDK73471.1 Hemolysin, contains CBS domains [Sarcina sp. DSM 11001]
MTELYLYIAGIIVCVLLSAFFSASEMSYSSCSRLRLEHQRDKGDKKASIAVRIHEKFDDALSAILVGNNLVNIAASSLGSLAVMAVLSDRYAWLSTLILTVVVVIFGETIPKITAKKNATRYALRFARPVRFLMIVLKPVTFVVVGLVSLITRLLPDVVEEDSEVALQELHTMIDIAENEDVLDEDASELVSAAIDFADISASEVMTARVDIIGIDIDDPWEEILHTIDKSPFSRIPVFEGSVDHVIGILSLNRFLKAMIDRDKVEIRKLLLPTCYVYKTMKLPAVLSSLRNAQQHLAVVTDEYGGTLGVVSMEDVLEELVGDIWDETDTIERDIVEKGEGLYELDGDTPIYEFLELMNMQESEFDFDSETVGGWCIEINNGFPAVNSIFTYENLEVRILAVTERRVRRVLVRHHSEEEKD